MFATDIVDCNVDQPGTGRISSRAEELAGPAPSPGGYVPCAFSAAADGIYSIVMTPFALNSTAPGTSTVGTPLVTTGQASGISIWDVTVRDISGLVQSGRLFANRLGLVTPPFGTQSAVNSFVYTSAGYVYRLQLFAPAAAAWDLVADGGGVIDAGTKAPIFASFQWGNANTGYPVPPSHTEAVAPQMFAPDLSVDGRFPVFFRQPDPLAISGPGGLAATRGYASAPIAPTAGFTHTSFVGAGGEQGATASGAGGRITLAAAPQMQGLAARVAIDLNGDGTFGNANDIVGSSGAITSAGATFAWDGRDAAGATPACGTYTYQVQSTLSAMHLVQSDTENLAGIQIQRLSLPSDPALPDPLAASYNDVDPYKSTAITNSSPSAVSAGISGPTFHAMGGSSGHTDFIDTWAPAPIISATGSFQVCLPPVPPATTVTTNAPTTKPPATKPARGGKKTGSTPRKVRLQVRKTVDHARIQVGGTATLTIRVRNPSGRVLHDVRVCETLAAGLVYVSATPRARFSAGRSCWTITRLTAHSARAFKVTVRALAGVTGLQVSRVTVNSSGVKAALATGAIRVVAGETASGGVTG